MKPYTDIMRGLREDKDLKQSDIANVIGTTQQQYSNYETGENDLPLRTLEMLANYYGVSADYLLGRTECKEGVDGLNKKVSPEYTIGALVSDVLSLAPARRAAVIEYIDLHKVKQDYMKKKEQDGKRP